MTYTYAWANAEKISVKREDEDGNVSFIPIDNGNRDYAEFLKSGITPAAYVAPEPQPEQKSEIQLLKERIAALEATQ